MNMNPRDILMRNELIFAPAVIGRSLSIWCIRGFAPLDELSAISLADVANDVTNQKAPQRHPNKEHAEEAFSYAITASENGMVRFFPEVILNVRDTDCLTLQDSQGNIELTSLIGPDRPVGEVTVRFDLAKISRSPVNPSISTVDGNHRLVEALEAKLEDPNLEFPVVSFAILVGLSSKEEAILFRDLNSKHRGMDASHLTALGYDLDDSNVLLRHLAGQANWLAHQLSSEGQPFHNMVRRYGNKSIYKEMNLEVPPMTLQMLTTAFKNTLSKSDWIQNRLDTKLSDEQLLERAVLVKNGLAIYWTAVKENFPDAWQDKKKYIFLKTIGIGAFSLLAATFIDNAIEQNRTSLEAMSQDLKHIASNVDLSVEHWKGVAGAGGTKRVYDALYEAMQKDKDLSVAIVAWGDPEISPMDSE